MKQTKQESCDPLMFHTKLILNLDEEYISFSSINLKATLDLIMNVMKANNSFFYLDFYHILQTIHPILDSFSNV